MEFQCTLQPPQLESRFFTGRMKGRFVPETDPIDVFIPAIPQTAAPRQPSATLPVFPQSHEHEEFPLQEVDFVQPIQIETEDETIDNFPELFDCFSSDGFDLEHFKNFARNFLRNRPERTDKKSGNNLKRKRRRLCLSWHKTSTRCSRCPKTK